MLVQFGQKEMAKLNWQSHWMPVKKMWQFKKLESRVPIGKSTSSNWKPGDLQGMQTWILLPKTEVSRLIRWLWCHKQQSDLVDSVPIFTRLFRNLAQPICVGRVVVMLPNTAGNGALVHRKRVYAGHITCGWTTTRITSEQMNSFNFVAKSIRNRLWWFALVSTGPHQSMLKYFRKPLTGLLIATNQPQVNGAKFVLQTDIRNHTRWNIGKSTMKCGSSDLKIMKLL